MQITVMHPDFLLRRRGAFLRLLIYLIYLVPLICLSSCNSSVVKDAVELAEGVDREQLDYSLLGVNAFANDPRFGSPKAQFAEVNNSLKINRVRVLMNWDDAVQPSPESEINFSFFDELIASVPEKVEILVVVTALPSWMRDPANWENDNPRETFVNKFFAKLVSRYSRVSAWQLWNEPNMLSNPDNTTLAVQQSAGNYVEMLALASNRISELAPGKILLNAATTAINQNYPSSLDYNREMRDSGAQAFVSAWAIHYYGKQFENLVRSGGVADFLNGLDKPIWVTESGAQGINQQLAYGETVWPYLSKKINGLQHIYIYQFSEATASDSTYGLRNLERGFELSDLYIKLRDR